MRSVPRLLSCALLAAALFPLAACDGNKNHEPELISGEIEISYMKGRWTYISLEDGRVVGTAVLGDEAADASWAARCDWDIAICDSLIRTNGGTSGPGQGAASGSAAASLTPDRYEDIW